MLVTKDIGSKDQSFVIIQNKKDVSKCETTQTHLSYIIT